MAKILDSATISSIVPKMIETSDSFIINGQVYDKTTLEPVKLKTIEIPTSETSIQMDSHAHVNQSKKTDFNESNNVLIDKYEPQYSYSIISEVNGDIRVIKFKTEGGNIDKVYQTLSSQDTHATFSTITQDASYIYGLMYKARAESYIGKIDKRSGNISFCSIGGEFSRVKIIKENTLFIYYAYSRANDRFAIGKYNKSTNSKTDIFVDNGENTGSYYTFSTPIVFNENEVLAIRSNITFAPKGIDNLILKKYLIDYNFDKVYDRNVDLDCSLLPKGILLRIENSTNWNYTCEFEADDNSYFTLWNREDKVLYLAKKTSDTSYSIIQYYELTQNYYGVLPYNDGKTLIFFTDRYIDFFSFRKHEERYELASNAAGAFTSIGIDRNKIIWLQHSDTATEMIGLNVPTITEALFTDTDINYENEDIETFIEVFTKNFDGELIESNVEVILNGPIKFSDTGLSNKKIKTSRNAVVRVPVTITNSGFVEANSIII